MMLLPLTTATLCLVLVSAAAAQKLVASFETEADVAKITLHNTDVALTDEGVTDGRKALRVHFAKVDWPNIFFSLGQAFDSADWSAFGGLAVDVLNPEANPIRVCIRVDDDPSADGSRHCRQGSAEAPPGKSTLVMPLPSAVPEGMRAGPPASLPGAITMSVAGGSLNAANTVAFQIFLPRPDAEHTLVFDNIVLLPKPDLNGIVDRYGQFTRAEWPGKVHDDADFAAQRDEERAWLQAHQPPGDRDEYGGWATGPTLRATGFFRTAYVLDGKETAAPPQGQAGQGRWWLVAPSGHLFFSLGIDCLRDNSGTPVQGRERLFSWLPDADDPLAAFSKPGDKRWANFYGMNLRRKHGEGWLNAWLDVTLQRYRAWGFNTIGNWSQADAFRLRRVPYTVAIHYGSREAPYFQSGWKTMIDVFHEDFARVAEAAIASNTTEWREDPWCLGYFVDNELSWGHWSSDPRAHYALPIGVLAHDRPLPARTEFLRLLRDKHGDIARLNEAWGAEVASWEALDQQGVELSAGLTQACVADLSELLTRFAERYFQVISAALRDHAPSQLYLGCRFAPRPQEVVDVAARYCDVVSFNIYSEGPDEKGWAFTAELGKPCLIGEFHFGALDRGMFHGGLRPVATQEARGRAYQTYVQRVWNLPAFVGCHWFQYADQALTGRSDGENYNIGFVSVADRPHWELVEAAREINATVYQVLGKPQG